MNGTLFKKGLAGLWKFLVVFMAILTLYITMIVAMYDPEMSKMLEEFSKAMPQLMSAVGMSGDSSTLLGFMNTYLYGFILLVFPMVFSMLCSYQLMAKYLERGSMASLLAAPVSRSTVVLTQMGVLFVMLVVLLGYATGLEVASAAWFFPGELELGLLLRMNLGLFCLQLFIGALCFLCCCLFREPRHGMVASVALPAVSFVLNMLSNVGEETEKVGYASFFTLYDAGGLLAGEGSAWAGCALLGVGALVFFALGTALFCRKDLSL